MNTDSANIDEIIPGLYLGNMSSAFNRELLTILDIKGIITVAKQIEPQFPSELDYLVIEIEDHAKEDISSHFKQTFEFIETKLAQGNVLVHCANGISRSPTIVMSYIMKKRGIGFEEAFQLVSKNRLCTNPNQGFRD